MPREVLSVTSYSSEPKGTDDIHMVYDASKSGLNANVWVQSFSLPSTDNLKDLLATNSWMADLDMGEQFLNFPLDSQMQPYCGIDLRPYYDTNNERGKTWWEGWCCFVMGFKPSPYVATKSVHLANEIVYGDRHDASNPLHWHCIQLNLPGSSSYSPHKPWVCKLREDDSIASGVPTYVDDMRPVGCNSTECWSAAHRVSTWYGFLGIKVAARKNRPPSQAPGAWAGAIVKTDSDGVSVSCSQEKWDKAKRMLTELKQEMASLDVLQFNYLEQKWGFFAHLQCTYPSFTPFLKGFHLTLDSWRPNRDSDGWKIASPAGFWHDEADQWVNFDHYYLGQPPTSVRLSPFNPRSHLMSDMSDQRKISVDLLTFAN
jgi:hypothetical protein